MGYETRFRHELKFEVDRASYMAIRTRLMAVCDPDPHTGQNGTYLIRSIYFDTPDNRALYEKINGAGRREKFRIRYYNDSLEYIALEKKQKVNDLCKKIDCPLTKDELCDILSGDTAFMKDHKEDLVRELYGAMTTSALRPRVLVSYTREPYVYAPGNVRVTFDSSIRTTMFSDDFTKDIFDVTATDSADMMIMEVKYDDFLPDIIKILVNDGNIRQQSFSKYEASRRYR
ncbi:MAG: polyphosphate polymerase domain-containing protein [Lachnospiraceae bacterium]|nr:polyphosphate polymerase domain-containing protein [Lachnospiraceae bacterium]